MAETRRKTKVCETCGKVFDDGRSHCPEDGAELREGDDELVGTSVGRYVLVRRLGRGAMGSVYLAIQPVIRSRVAVKVLNREAAEDPGQLKRFVTEAQAVNRIQHPNIVKILDLDELEDGRPFVLMEYLQGRTLRERMKQARPMDAQEIRSVVDQVLDALEAAHKAGFVHRDLKPDNIFITELGKVKLLDFGITKLIDAPDGAAKTQAGTVLGTPMYLSPEQASGRVDRIGPCTDLYALGVILYQLHTGELPYKAETVYTMITAHIDQDPIPPRQKNPRISAKLEQVILWCLKKDPRDRPKTADDLRQAYSAAFDELAQGFMDTVASDRLSTLSRQYMKEAGVERGLDGAGEKGPGKEMERSTLKEQEGERSTLREATGQPEPMPSSREADGPGATAIGRTWNRLRQKAFRVGLPLAALALVLTTGVYFLVRGLTSGKGKGQSTATEKPVRPTSPLTDRLVVLQGKDVESLDPLKVEMTESINILSHVFEPLIVFDAITGEMQPWLAVGWDVDSSRKVYTFTIRSNVRFHDGSLLDAGMVASSIKRTLSSALGKTYLWDLLTVEAEGNQKVVLSLSKPSGSFLIRMSLWPAFITKPGSEHPEGTGPFRVASHNPSAGTVLLRAVKGYWGKPVRTRTLVFKATSDEVARASLLLQADAHVSMGLSPKAARRLGKEPSVRIFKSAANVGVYLFFNTRKPDLADPKIRQALCRAVDVKAIIKELYRGEARPASGSLPAVLSYMSVGSDAAPPRFSAEAARTLLKGRPITRRALKLYLLGTRRISVPRPKKAAAVLKQSFALAGIRLEPVFLDPREFHEACARGDHDLALFGWIPDYPDPENIYFLLSREGSRKGYNLALFSDDEFDGLLDRARTETDLGRRKELFRALEKLVAQKRPWLPLVNVSELVAVRQEVKGIRIGLEQCVGGADLFLRKAHLDRP